MNNNIIALAKKLRKNSTNAENLLWGRLRVKQLEGLKFRRQQQIGNYIVDFVCFEKKMVIEIDGGQHSIEKEKDNIRDEWLKEQGFRVLRFWNNEVLMNIESVLEVIRMNCISPSPDPSHQGRGNESGFTLIEMIMVIVLISIISGIAAMLILQGAKSYQKEASYSDIHNQGRLAIERMAREIRLIRGCNDIAAPLTNPDTDLQFIDVSGNTIRFYFSSPNLQRSENGGALQTLASNVQSLAFNYYDRNNALTTSCAASPTDVWNIQIDLTTVNVGETLSMRLRVHPRNF